MGYTKTTWVDQVKDGNGNIVQVGTPVNAANLNNIENGIAGDTHILDWAANKAYGANDIVVYSGKIYRALSNFTSGASFNASNWAQVGGATEINDSTTSTTLTWSSSKINSYVTGDDTILPWAPSKAYAVNNVVQNNNNLYLCITAHTSGTTFSGVGTNWTQLSNPQIINDSSVSTSTAYSSSKATSTFTKGNYTITVGSTQPSSPAVNDIWIVTP